MTVTVQFIGEDERKPAEVAENASRVFVEGWKCECGGTAIGGRGKEIESHDTYRALAGCLGCGTIVGVLRAKMETVFGLEEDERVLNGPWRVY